MDVDFGFSFQLTSLVDCQMLPHNHRYDMHSIKIITKFYRSHCSNQSSYTHFLVNSNWLAWNWLDMMIAMSFFKCSTNLCLAFRMSGMEMSPDFQIANNNEHTTMNGWRMNKTFFLARFLFPS
jgi:hypothetical protein